MAFSEQEKTDMDFVRDLLGRAPTLNSAEVLRRLRAHQGRYPTTRVQHWLHASVGDHQHAQDDVAWRRGGRSDDQSGQDGGGGGGGGNPPGDQEPQYLRQNATAAGDGEKRRENKLQLLLLAMPWHRPNGMTAEVEGKR